MPFYLFWAGRKTGRMISHPLEPSVEVKVCSPGYCGISLFADIIASIMGTFVKDRQLLQ